MSFPLHREEVLREFADFTIMRLRKELNLWFDVNSDLLLNSRLAFAFLTDGANFLMVDIHDRPGDCGDMNSVKLVGCNVVVHTAKWVDIPQSYDEVDLKRLVRSSLAAFKARRLLERFADVVSLVSFEVKGIKSGEVETVQRWLTELAVRLGGAVYYMPEFAGLKSFGIAESSSDSSDIWAQIVFRRPVERHCLLESLQPTVMKSETLRTGENVNLRTRSDFKTQTGILWVSICARRF